MQANFREEEEESHGTTLTNLSNHIIQRLLIPSNPRSRTLSMFNNLFRNGEIIHQQHSSPLLMYSPLLPFWVIVLRAGTCPPTSRVLANVKRPNVDIIISGWVSLCQIPGCGYRFSKLSRIRSAPFRPLTVNNICRHCFDVVFSCKQQNWYTNMANPAACLLSAKQRKMARNYLSCIWFTSFPISINICI